ncbi:hypothetical protein [Paraburkholderia sp. BL9I2N2]|uniref:hypothetical protein n=1 Tax=Paraburkholderia sp. BL9I2N2 TaxID=1938809 RepID=UPI001FB243AC|nr:hypothetical protein [Paraburkholderia sp. BL9I2N2]
MTIRITCYIANGSPMTCNRSSRQRALQASVAVIETLSTEIHALELTIHREVRLRPEFAILKTTPGIGEILAATRIVRPTVEALADVLRVDQARRLVQFSYRLRAPFAAPADFVWRRFCTVWRNAPPANVWELQGKPVSA